MASEARRYWLGIDIGGTFTDFALYDTATGALTGLKVPSTPPAFADAVRDGLDQLAREHGVDLREIGTVVHGTTIAVNTVIQRTGARLGLLVTEGFRDVLELQRLRLPNPFDLDGSRPLPLIPRSRVAEVRERLRADGRSTRPSTRRACRPPRAACSARTSRASSCRCSTPTATPITSAGPGRLPRGPHRAAGERLVRRLAAGARVRADRARRARRLRAAPGAALPRGLRARTHRPRRARSAVRDEVERRDHARGRRAGADRGDAALRAGFGGDRRRLRRQRGRRDQRHHARRRRHQRGHRGRRGRSPAREHQRARRRGAGDDAGGGGDGHRRRRRLGGLGGRRGRAQGRPAEHRCSSRPGLLRARRHGGHAHRRLPRVGLPRSGPIPRGAHAPRSGAGRGGHRPLRRPARDDAARGRRERGARGRLEHVRGIHQDPLARRGGPSRLRPRRLRWGGAGSGRAPGPRSGHLHGFHPALPGNALCAGGDQRGHRERRRAERARRAVDGRRPGRSTPAPCASSTTRSRPSWPSGSNGMARARARQRSATRRTCATWGSRTRSRCRWTRPGSRRAARLPSSPPSTRRTSGRSGTRTGKRRRRS